MRTKRTAWFAATAAAAGIAVAGAVAWPAHGAQTGASTAQTRSGAITTMAPPFRCGADNPVIGYLGVTRSGQAAAARRVLGPELLAQVGTAGGVLDLARLPASRSYPNSTGQAASLSAAQRSALFTRWLPVRALPQQAGLRSCADLMNNRPAAQALVRAAIAAVVRHGDAASARHLTAELQDVLISDNPAATNSVIVTLMVPGQAYHAIAKGAPLLHRLASYTVIMTESASHVTGVANGGF